MAEQQEGNTGGKETTPTRSTGTTPLPPPNVRPRKEQRFSWIWLVPLLAVAMGAGLLLRDWMNTGPTITIAFESAEGSEVGHDRNSTRLNSSHVKISYAVFCLK